MTAVVIALAVPIIVLAGGIVIIIGWARVATEARIKAKEEQLSTERKCLDLEDDRDAERARASKAETEAAEAKKASAIHEAAARAAREELTKYVREKLASGSDDDVAAEVDRLLGVLPKAVTVPDVSTTPASDDRGPI